MAIAREGWRGRSQTAKGRGEARNIGILGQRQVTLSWADDPVLRHDVSSWRGCWGRRRLPPPEGHWTAGREDKVGQEEICNNKQHILGSGGVAVRYGNSTTS